MERYINAERIKQFFQGRRWDLFSADTICSIIDLMPDEHCIYQSERDIIQELKKPEKEDKAPDGYAEITNRIQSDGNMNRVYYYTEKGPGGAYHEYMIVNGRTDDLLADILFQKGPRNEVGSVQGILDVDLLEIVRHRFKKFVNGDMADANTESALNAVELALMYLERRYKDRKERGVLGKMER